MIDWGQAGQIAGFGFLTVFLVLCILSIAVWIVSLLMHKTVGKNKKEETKEKAVNT